MSNKRPHNSRLSDASVVPIRRPKRRKMSSQLRAERSPSKNLFRSILDGMSNLVTWRDSPALASPPFHNGHASSSSSQIEGDSDDDENNGTLAMLAAHDRTASPSASPSGGSTHPIDLTAEGDDGEDNAPGPSRRRRPSSPPHVSIYPQLPARLFPEGSLNPDLRSPTFGPNGSVSSGQSDGQEENDESDTENSHTDLISPILHPNHPPVLRNLMRPDVRLEERFVRHYDWMRGSRSPGSTSSRSSQSSKRSSSKYHSAPTIDTLRSPKQQWQRRNIHSQSQTRRTLDDLGEDPGPIGKAARRVKEMLRPTRLTVPARREEQRFQQRLLRKRNSLSTFRELLGQKKTLEERIDNILAEARYQPQSKQKASASARQLAKTQPSVDVVDILSKLRIERQRQDDEVERRLAPKVPKQLPTDQDEQVRQSLRDRSFKRRCRTQEVTYSSLSRLQPEQWLDDEIINFYGAMLQDRSEKQMEGLDEDQGSGRKIHYFNSFFYSKLRDQGYEAAKLKRWTKKVDIFAMDAVIFPINIGNAHWTAAAINFEKKRFEYYDSMGDLTSSRQRTFKELRAYLDAEHRDKKLKPFDFSGWADMPSGKTPQQDNGYDCGVFSCQTLEAIARGRDLNQVGQWEFKAENMFFLRNLMVYEIGTGKLVKRW